MLLEYSQEVTTRRRAEETRSLGVTQATLKKLQGVIVLQDEGIVYCPIPKVASSEWKRALRWMVGIEEWEGTRSNLHKIVSNGLERLTDRGLEETRWALESDRYLKFVVVRDPAERLVSGFLNKCVKEGYESGGVTPRGAQNCPYLQIMPELFPGAERASLATHARLQELTDADPEDVFFRFASGIYREVEANDGNTCKVANIHYRPQSCFCDLVELLPAYHVMPFANLSQEAEALAARLPAKLPDSDVGVEVDGLEAGGVEGMAASNRITGVDNTRREEIHQFLAERFTEYHKVDPMGATGAADSKAKFLSERVLEVVHKMYVQDYELFAEYL
eukprot:jgi/Undpi1/5022/HiC_scaffold_19.g08374.m1